VRTVRRAVPLAILTGCLGVGVLPALAADQSVAVRDFAFAPSRVAVMPGESVTWQGTGTASMHDVHFAGETALGPPSNDFHASRAFPDAGEFHYVCDVHPAEMRGTVYVNATGTVPEPTPSPTPTASPTPAPSNAPTATPAPGGGAATPAPAGAPAATVVSFRARATHGRFCTRRSAHCRRPGVFLSLDLGASKAVLVRGTLRRGSRRVRTISLRARPGRHRARLPGRALGPGRYALTLRAGAITRRVRFRVRLA
jgi:hypothetical protein